MCFKIWRSDLSNSFAARLYSISATSKAFVSFDIFNLKHGHKNIFRVVPILKFYRSSVWIFFSFEYTIIFGIQYFTVFCEFVHIKRRIPGDAISILAFPPQSFRKYSAIIPQLFQTAI